MKITVALPTFNRPDRLRVCLESYNRQTLSKDLFCILVADNKPTHETRQVIHEYSSRLNLTYVKQPLNCQFTGNLALLLSRVKTPFVKVQYDDDFIYPDFLKRALACIEADDELVGYVCGGDFVNEQGNVINRYRPLLDTLMPSSDEFSVWGQTEMVSASYIASAISMHTGLYRSEPLQTAMRVLYPVFVKSSYSVEKMFAALMSDKGGIIYDRRYSGGSSLWHNNSLTQIFGEEYREREFQFTSNLVLEHALARGFSPFSFLTECIRVNPNCAGAIVSGLERATGNSVDANTSALQSLEQTLLSSHRYLRLPRFDPAIAARRLIIAPPFQPSILSSDLVEVPSSLCHSHALIVGRLGDNAWNDIITDLREDGIEDLFWIYLFDNPGLWIEELHKMGICSENFAQVDLIGLDLLPTSITSYTERLRTAYDWYMRGVMTPPGTAVDGSGFLLRFKIKSLKSESISKVASASKGTIAVVTPQLGGISETFIHRHINNFPRCVVLTGEILNEYEPLIPTMRIPYQNGDCELSSEWDIAISSFFAKHGVDRILVEYGCYGTSLLYWNRQKWKLPAFVHFHGGDSSFTFLNKSEWVAYYKNLPSLVRGIFTGPQSMARRLHHICEIPMALLYPKRYGVEVPIHIHRPLPTGIIRLVFIGRLTPKKSPDNLLRAFRHAVSLFPDLFLDIVGDDGLSYVSTDNRRNLQDTIDEWGLSAKIKMHGTLTPQRSCEILEQSHIYVQHSVTAPGGDVEGMPIVILEAAARGLPVISTRHEGIVEEVDDGVTGYLVDEHDFVAMAERIVDLARNPERILEMGRAGHAKMLKDFTVEREVRNLCYLMGCES